MILEVCVDSIDGLQAAITGGADRIELCSALSLGGLTPSVGLMHAAAATGTPCYAMIRPRSGDFHYSQAELELMAIDIDHARAAGLSGVVFGANLADGRLDRASLAFLSQQARGLGKTLHRAFDLVPDLDEAIEIAIKLGFERILTSGRKRLALEGIEDLKRAVEIAAGRIVIMPGSGISSETIPSVLTEVLTTEVHASCSVPAVKADQKLFDFGFIPAESNNTDTNKVRRLKNALVAFMRQS